MAWFRTAPPTPYVKAVDQPNGDHSIVFEFDGETSYFYLATRHPEPKILKAIHVRSGAPDFDESELQLAWDGPQGALGIRGRIVAIYDVAKGTQEGGTAIA